MTSSSLRRRDEARALLWIGGLLVLLGLATNELLLEHVWSTEGWILDSTRRASRWIQPVLVVLGLAIALLRRPLADRLTMWQPLADDGRSALRAILVLGVLLRVVVFVYLAPQNNDDHWSYIRFLVEQRRSPIANELMLAFQPPLYYLTAVPWAIDGSMKVTQVWSLLLGLVNLGLIYRIVTTTRLLRSPASRCLALLFAAVLPQFVIFSSFVSNDALAYPLGTLFFLQAFRYVSNPTRGNALLLGAVEGLGLVTKGTLIANAPALAALVVVMELRKRESLTRRLATIAAAGLVAVLLGSYKFVENQVHFGTPVVDNEILGQNWVESQQGTIRGPASLVDANVLALCERPYNAELTRHSLPLLLYGTFWISYIRESNLNATRHFPYDLIRRGLVLAAVVPTLLMIAGLAERAWRSRDVLRLLRTSPGAAGADAARLADGLGTLTLICGLATAFALVFKWGIAHDAWSFFQARLVFPTFLAIAFAHGWGYELVERRGLTTRWLLNAALVALYVLIGAYWAVELGKQAIASGP